MRKGLAEVHHGITFCLSLPDDRAGFVTGQVLCVCGSMTVGVPGLSAGPSLEDIEDQTPAARTESMYARKPERRS